MTTRKMRVGDFSIKNRKRLVAKYESATVANEELQIVDKSGYHHFLQTRDDQGLEYPQFHKVDERRGTTWTKTVRHSGAGPCTVHMGTGITRVGYPAHAMGALLGEYFRRKLGYNGGGLAWIIFTEAEPSTSGKRGHHDYRGYPAGGSRMADFCDKYGPVFGEWYRSPPRGGHTGTATGLRVLAYAPPPMSSRPTVVATLKELQAREGLSAEDRDELKEFETGFGAGNGW